MDNNQPLSGKLFFTHVEFGYTTDRGERIIPNPEWSGPSNQRTLDEVDRKVERGVVDRAFNKVLDIMERNRARGLFLAFPYFAEKHPDLLKRALAGNHIVSVHMHENWKAITSNNKTEDITTYIKSEKARLEKAIGGTLTIFSYGPGIQFDTMGGKERPPNYGILTEEEIRKLFQAIGAAGFTFIQTAREYQSFLPSGLQTLDAELIGLPHSFEWYNQREEIREIIDSINERTRSDQSRDNRDNRPR
jgi:peptidoglycan/xylan/chitin deacetylase (PgdA/CDA1 family)